MECRGKRVVVVGGGIAGVAAAKALRRGRRQVDVTIAARDPFYAAGPGRPLILTSEQIVDRIMRGYEPLQLRVSA